MKKQVRVKRFRMIIPKYPSFNIYSNAAKKITALGPICVATSVSKMGGWEVEVIDENNYRYPGPVNKEGCPDQRFLQELRPADAVGLYGGLSCTIPRLYELASYYRSEGVLTIAGGQHPDFEPEEVLKNGVDVVVHGEGEVAIREVLEAWESGGSFEGVKGVSFFGESGATEASREGGASGESEASREGGASGESEASREGGASGESEASREGGASGESEASGGMHRTEERAPIDDFEALPLPDFGLLRFAKVSIYPVSRVRGCGKNCEFCSVKGKARCGSAERLLEQFAYLAETYGARRFFVVDDHFAQDREEAIRFCRLITRYQRRMGVSFFIFIQIRLETAKDEELIEAMKSAGVRVLAIGYESVIDDELKSMRKGMRARDLLDWTRRFQRAGFIIHGMFIFGYPHRTGERCELSLKERVRCYKRFLRKSRLDTVQVLHPVPLPGTALRDRMMREGRLLSGDEISWEYYDGNFPLIQPDPPVEPQELQDATLRIMKGFYRFHALFFVILRVLLFPLLMLPPVHLRSRFRTWYRLWRRNILGFTGWSLIKKWRKNFRGDAFKLKLKRVMSRRGAKKVRT